jgi:hypothetical protein
MSFYNRSSMADMTMFDSHFRVTVKQKLLETKSTAYYSENGDGEHNY